jgi:hypothetical protein
VYYGGREAEKRNRKIIREINCSENYNASASISVSIHVKNSFIVYIIGDIALRSIPLWGSLL